ncbi:hypothetical protein [Microbispora corallina]|nr:hypothetical protein [Microbispora corallina]
MSPRSSVMPIMASGTATAAKLLVATLAVTAAYIGASNAAGGERLVTRVAGTAATTPAVQREQATGSAGSAVTTGAFADSAPAPGTVTLAATPGGEGCARVFRARALLSPGDAGDAGLSYGWSLQRWNTRERVWQTYLSTRNGFAGASRVVEFAPTVVDNPGLYRVRLQTGAHTYHSSSLRIAC